MPRLQKAVYETPFAIVFFERVDVTACADRLQRKPFQLLVDGEVADGSRLLARGVDIDDDVRNLLPRTRGTVPMSLDTSCEVLFDTVAGAGGFTENVHRRVLEQVGHLIELTVVQEMSVGREQACDGAFSVEACHDVGSIGHVSSFLIDGPKAPFGLEVS